MKKIIIPLITFIALFMFVVSCEKETAKSEEVGHSGIEIGRVINDELIITYDVPTLKRTWSSHINHSPDLKIQLTSISIEENNDGIFLYGIDEINKTKSRFDLVLDNSIIYHPLINNSRLLGGCTTTCSGCESTGPASRGECSPQGTGNQTYCSSCSKGSCSKTVTCGAIM